MIEIGIYLLVLIWLFFFCVSISIYLNEDVDFSYFKVIICLLPIVNIMFVVKSLIK